MSKEATFSHSMHTSFLRGKVVVVTGGSSGIGKALVKEAIEAGAQVATCSRNTERLATELNAWAGEKLLCVRADVSKQEDCQQLITETIERFGKIDVLVCNAGISMRALFADTDVQVLHQLMNINFWGTVYCVKAALPYIIQNKGNLVGISSIAGYRGLPGRTGYSASKFAMQGFLESLRTELLYSGVQVMWVSPGFTASNIRNTALNHTGQTQQETPLEEHKLMSAAQVAQAIWTAVEKRKRTKVMTLQGKLAVWLNKLWPSLADKKVYDVFANEPNSPLPKRPN